MSTLRNLYEKHVVRRPGCWGWSGTLDRDGYGQVSHCVNGRARNLRANRVSWELTYGHPGTAHVLHTCDDRACTRPEHLFLGNHATNMADMTSKGRAARGVTNGNVVLTPDLVRSIRHDYASGAGSFARLASIYGVGTTAIRYVIRRVTWKHVY